MKLRWKFWFLEIFKNIPLEWDITEIEILHQNWEISFEINPTAVINSNQEIIRIGVGILVVSLNPTSKLVIEINGTDYETPEIALYDWTSISILQSEQNDGTVDFIVFQNSIEIHREPVENQNECENVKIFFNETVYAKLRNVYHKTSATKIIGKLF